MPSPIRKAPFECPQCGFVQQEPVHLISTYCRSCGEYYEIAGRGAAAAPRSERRNAPRLLRSIRCYRCGQNHEVSSSAKSTICPGCTASIELGNLTFASNVSRPVDTRGDLTVTSSGYLNNTFIVCGNALIEGRVTGTLRCEGTLRFASSKKQSCRVIAKSVVIEKGCEMELAYPLKTQDLTVFGRAVGQFECTGNAHIRKGGLLEGQLTARSVIVERGGVLLADSSIQPRRLSEIAKPEGGGDSFGADPAFAY